MQITVREAEPADAPRVAEIHEQSIRRLTAESYRSDIVEVWARGKNPGSYPIDSDGIHFVIAECDDGVVGFGELVIEAADYFHADVAGEIRAIYTHPDFARKGIGSAIYTELEAEARAHHLDSVGLWSSLNAVPFYEFHGFESIKRITHEFGGEVEGPAVEMKKDL